MGCTCADRSSPFQQQLEAIRLGVECGIVQGGIPIHSLGIQVSTSVRDSGNKEGEETSERAKVRGKEGEEGREKEGSG